MKNGKKETISFFSEATQRKNDFLKGREACSMGIWHFELREKEREDLR
jgi:hypothetical protein